MATASAPNSSAWAASRSGRSPPAASPTTRKCSGLARMMSSAWVPTEPVDPSSTTLRVTRPLSPTVGRCCANVVSVGSWTQPVVVGLGEVAAAGGAGPAPSAAVAVHGPAGVGFEEVPAAGGGVQVVSGAGSAVALADHVVEVGGGGAGGAGGRGAGVAVAQRDELGERGCRRVTVGVGVEVRGGDRCGEQRVDELTQVGGGGAQRGAGRVDQRALGVGGAGEVTGGQRGVQGRVED